jgi:hypothetical protein
MTSANKSLIKNFAHYLAFVNIYEKVTTAFVHSSVCK